VIVVPGCRFWADLRADLVPRGVTLAVDSDALVLHVLAAPTAEQIEAEIGEAPAAEAEEGAAAPELVPEAPADAAEAEAPEQSG
jgi:large subunit ribosomal protein L25